MATLTQDRVLELVDELITQQSKKVMRIADSHYPGINAEDIRNPQDFPKLIADAQFNFEDGILAGYIAAKIALIRELRSEGGKNY